MRLDELQKIFSTRKFWFFILVIGALSTLIVTTVLIRGSFLQEVITGIEGEIPVAALKVKVIRVEPLPDQKGISTSPTIKISFEKSIKGKKVQVTSSPKAAFNRQLSSGGYYLTLTTKKPLKVSTKYTINVLAGKSKIYSWDFTTGKKSGDPATIKKITDKLPYIQKHFSIGYSASTDKFFVTIDAKPIDIYKQKALDWFASQGLADAEKKINIVFFPVGPAAD